MTRGQLNPERLNLDKWQMHLALEDAKIPQVNLPDTVLLHNFKDMYIRRHRTWYVKPVNTWGGHQIAKIDRRETDWSFQPQGGRTELYRSPLRLLNRVRQQYDPLATILQQGAPVTNLNGRPFDIRVLCQRGDDNQWLIAGSLARVGRKDSIVSNIGTGHGEVFAVDSLLSQLYQNKSVRSRIKHTLDDISNAICSMLDGYWQFEEVGLDLGLTAKGSVWLFEVNTNDTWGGPSHELFMHLPDKSIYEAIEARADKRRRRWLAELMKEIIDH
ncbi:YheC/YheD family protein [Alicyclobacillus dauci]|uniref:YheC/YheD family protein n=1 Tax=Alicyclobacillus dauci TaxID=1475485 RepID=A0ABY6Z333_9BACL|nr:YheC/YheD family protein [Alicyclobacillus dauci]WAH37298.1 YheC/YheD family protein [Alicyclobacillus dauci]